MKRDLAIFCPLPPVRSGTADYCAEQLAPLSRDWSITVVVERDADRTDPVPPGVSVVDLETWRADRRRDERTPRLYHLGNNPAHAYCLAACLERPGVIMLHDFVLHHLVVEMTLARGQSRSYAEIMEAYDRCAVSAYVRR